MNETKDLSGRFLAALVSVADRKQLSALVPMHEAQLSVVVLPELGAGVAIVERGSASAESLTDRLRALLKAHEKGVLHLVLAGGGESDVALLRAADREAPDPNRLGVHLLTPAGRVRRVAGRRLGLLATAAALLDRTAPLSPADLDAHNDRTQKHHEERARFGAALERRPQWATRLLGGVSIVLFALAYHWGGGRNFSRALIAMGANHRYLVEDGEVFRLLAHAFLHATQAHIIVNMIGLFSFGGFLEGILGWRRIVILYGVSALGGGLASAFIGEAHLSVGASGAIWGFMAAGLGIVLRKGPILPPSVAARLRPRLLWVLALNTALSLAPFFVSGFPKIDLWAHLGGGIAGFALAGSGLLTRGLSAGSDPQELAANPRWLQMFTALVLAALMLAVAMALWTGKPWDLRVMLDPDELA